MTGVARLPVLAVHAILSVLTPDVGRYRGCALLPLEHHNTADTRTDLIGDVHIVDADNTLFEGYEVKHNIPISSSLIQSSFEKLRTTPVKKFYILTTYHHDSYTEFEPDIQRVAQEHGCELTVNGVDPTLRYYLRLIGDTREFVNAYVTHLETDPSVTFELKEAWNQIVSS
jgi:DNA (cytosine-5)-methyltransferase 1